MKLFFSLFLILISIACESPVSDQMRDDEAGSMSNFSGECRLNSDCELGFKCDESTCVGLEAEVAAVAAAA